VGAHQLDQTITLVGYEFDRSDRSFELQLYWQTEIPITTRYKVFAQLLRADNVLFAQSDSFPAAERRPTTGWLPQEIIRDTHNLELPPEIPADSYQLIAGLYDPLTGERLSILNENGEPIADAIFLTRVNLP
jgi:hypothetical protein